MHNYNEHRPPNVGMKHIRIKGEQNGEFEY